ncbi:MAG: 1,4-alpha-glucan branching protein GlgB [Candidatus Eremiobacteraeota bacterium]|nr:1,4-alpha-glucan branching protein GlgB [Candidatus Eremiobacteraeota bacterium]
MLLDKYWTDPFSFLGPHVRGDDFVVRTSAPQASRVFVAERDGNALHEMQRIDGEGLFELVLRNRKSFPYCLDVETAAGRHPMEDPYRFGPILGDIDAHLIGEGTHRELWRVLGSHRRTIERVEGVAFAVWAPNALRASVVGDFNDWDGRRHPMRKRVECGVWEIFVPGVREGARYKYELEGAAGGLLPLKADPLARYAQLRPDNASIVHEMHVPPWRDDAWMRARAVRQRRDAPISVYEVHAGSWRRGEDGRFLTYRELADSLLPYVAGLGFTHVELLPVTEYPFDGSWGYQPTGMYAPTSRYGLPEDFRAFVERAHELELGVILDWVPGHFPDDPFGLARFDGTHLYEHDDPRKGFHPDWNTLIYNHGRREVANFLVASALYWLREFHVDGLRVDAVASMLYLDYSRREGQWVPNEYGGNENIEAIAFLKALNDALHVEHPSAITIAEESTSWPLVSRTVAEGGLGFSFKWNMGWMHDTLRYFGYDPVYRRYHQSDLTFGLVYAFSENYVLPFSHDEVVHGKRSLLGKMPGDRWQQFANLRALLALTFAHPGKKLLFMGDEIAAVKEWNHDAQLDWQLLDDPLHAGIGRLVRDCNRLYRAQPALYELDTEPEGFEWIDFQDSAHSVLAFARRGRDRSAPPLIAVLNATPVARYGYRIGVSEPGSYGELLNTDSEHYGGSNVGNQGSVDSEEVAAHGRPHSLSVTLPPLAMVIFRAEP